MDELVTLVQEKTGLSKAQAKMAVDTVLNFLKDKLPAPLASQLDSVLDNEGMLDKGIASLGGLLGKK